jgi:hypothetical protein
VNVNVEFQPAALTEGMLMGYIAKRRNDALEAIDDVDASNGPALTSAVLVAYAEKGYTSTARKVKLADDEMLCLTQAIYHEARGESRDGQLAVANVIINRAMSKKYPSTICGVVFQNADKGRYKCQFTFACDGRSDMGTERAAWNRSIKMAREAFYEFQKGERSPWCPTTTAIFFPPPASRDRGQTEGKLEVLAAGAYLCAIASKSAPHRDLKRGNTQDRRDRNIGR